MSLRNMDPKQRMRRSLFRLAGLATAGVALLLFGFAAIADPSPAYPPQEECAGESQVPALPRDRAPDQPQEVSVAEIPGSEVGSPLSDPDGLQIELEQVLKRPAGVSPLAAGSRFALGFACVESGTNWGATFSPRADTCVLLSRFRI